MVAVVSVVRFDSQERDLLAADKADRSKLAKSVGAELTTLVNTMFTDARELADKDPDQAALSQATQQVASVESVLQLLPRSETITALVDLCARIRGIIDSAAASLPQ